MRLGLLGVWSPGLRDRDSARVAEAAAELEELGYGTLWFPAGRDRGFEIGATLLRATRSVTVATGIVSVWNTSAEEARAGFADLERVAPGRFLLGIGISHAPMVNRGAPNRYTRPIETMSAYLSALDDVPRERRIIGALGPRMLELATRTSLGTHPYLITAENTAKIRAEIGPDPVVAPELGVVIETDPDRARTIAREHLSTYLVLPNYVNNWLRTGFTPDDVEDGGSDRLVDSLIAWGSPEQVAARIQDHRAAGADHVCVQVLGGDAPLPLPQWRALAAAAT